VAGSGCPPWGSGVRSAWKESDEPMTIPFALALAGGTLIFVGVLVVGFLVFSYSWYTRRGSAINQHPYGDIDHNSGRETPSELAHDVTQDVRNWDRGVEGRRRRRHPPSG
jgi:hypothetical protein